MMYKDDCLCLDEWHCMVWLYIYIYILYECEYVRGEWD